MNNLIFIRQHSDDGELLINLNHIIKIKVSDDGYNASVITINDSKWIRTNMLYSELEKLITVL